MLNVLEDLRVGDGDQEEGTAIERVPNSFAGLIEKGYVRLGSERQEYVNYGKLTRKNHEKVFAVMGYKDRQWDEDVISFRKDTYRSMVDAKSLGFVEINGMSINADRKISPEMKIEVEKGIHGLSKTETGVINSIKYAEKNPSIVAVFSGVKKLYIPKDPKQSGRVWRPLTYTVYDRIHIFGDKVSPSIFDRDPSVEIPEHFCQFEQAYKTVEEAKEYVKQGRIMIKTRLNQIRLLKQDEQYKFRNHANSIRRKAKPVLRIIDPVIQSSGSNVVPFRMPIRRAVNDRVD